MYIQATLNGLGTQLNGFKRKKENTERVGGKRRRTSNDANTGFIYNILLKLKFKTKNRIVNKYLE